MTTLTPTRLLDEVRSELRLFVAINRLLDGLLAQSLAQTELSGDAAWQEALERKQILLDEVEALEPAVRVRQARVLAEQLLAAEQWEIAAHLQEAVRVMRERFLALMECEQAAEQTLQGQVDELRDALFAQRCRQQATTAYQGATSRRPRFVNLMR